MFNKKTIIVLFVSLFITACGNQTFACSLDNNEKRIDIDISAFNDDITSIKVRTSYELPMSLMNDEKKLSDFVEQLDDNCHFENDNILVIEYEEAIDDKYSVSKTIEHLQRDNFYCE